MSFLRRGRKSLADSQPAPLDHDLLVSALAAQKSAAAKAETEEPAKDDAGPDPLTELLTGGPDWKEAVVRQGGCFNSVEAGRARKGR